jgi:hypothetical protein
MPSADMYDITGPPLRASAAYALQNPTHRTATLGLELLLQCLDTIILTVHSRHGSTIRMTKAANHWSLTPNASPAQLS